MNYNFSQLDDKEFEFFVMDLLQKVLNIDIDRYKQGKDGGIDGRFFITQNEEAIIQCKQYLNTGYKGMIYALKYKGKDGKVLNEVEKVKKIDPKRFLFVTDLPLSPTNKREIKDIFKPHIKSVKDIFGKENLNQYLSQYPEIEKQYYRLWINTSNVLDYIFNNAIITRSRYELERIAEKSKMFVETDSFRTALKRLKEERVIIITGQPGIGKTTLSENLCLLLSSPVYEYQFIDIKDSLKDAEDLWKDDVNQLFYYDDFLGSSYFEAIENKKDSYIMSFIDRVARAKNKEGKKSKMFILNSRTNILNYGKYYSVIFKNEDIEKNEYILAVDDLSEYEKGQILYKHIYFSDISNELKEIFYENKNYRKIINHKNFNPRIIQFITNCRRVRSVDEGNYLDYILGKLKNPEDIWNDTFDYQVNENIRVLVSSVVFSGGKIGESYLEYSYNLLLKEINNHTTVSQEFNFMIKLAVESLLNRSKIADDIFYKPFDPSVSDYVLNRYIKNTEYLMKIYSSLNNCASLITLRQLNKQSSQEKIFLSGYNYKSILESICNSKVLYNNTVNYLLILADILSEEDFLYNKLIEILNFIIKQEVHYIKNCNKLFSLINLYYEDLEADIENFFSKFLCFFEYNLLEDIRDLMILIDKSKIYDSEKFIGKFEEIISHGIEGYLIDRMDEYAEEIDLEKYLGKGDSGYYMSDYYINSDNVMEDIVAYGNELLEELEEFGLIKIESVDKLLSEMSTNIDCLIDDYITLLYHNDEREVIDDDYYGKNNKKEYKNKDKTADQLDDLFSR